MTPDDSDRPPAPDPGLSHVYDLADRLASEVAKSKPDWGAVARDASELAREAAKRCASNPDN